MKINKFYIFLILLTFVSCKSDESTNRANNLLPMYGEVLKNEEYKNADDIFIKECLEKYTTIDSSFKVITKHGWSYFYHNDLETSMKRFNQSWLLNPEYPDSYFGFAALLEMKGDFKEAKRFYQLGYLKDVTKKRAEKCFQDIAYCKENLNDIKGAIKAYNSIIKLNSNNVFAYKKIGYLETNLSNYESALNALNKAIELDSLDAMTFNNKGYLFQLTNKYNEAIIEYSKAIYIDSKNIKAYVNRGLSKLEILDYESAKRDFEICTKLDPKSGELWRCLGIAKYKLNDKNGACDDFELAIKLGYLPAEDLIKEYCKK